MGFSAEESLLGQKTEYVSVYDPSILYPIPRALNRESLPNISWKGVDIWTGYELSWLNTKGKPQVAIAEFIFSANSANIVESKSFKLYLNSFNQTRLDSVNELITRLTRDLSAASGSPVEIRVQLLGESSLPDFLPNIIDGLEKYDSIDGLDVEVSTYHTDASLLVLDSSASGDRVEENLVSHLLKSNCPVTGQPDWASVFIAYKGRKICHEGLLKYIISYREHQDFHENCVERIYAEIMQACEPESLKVYARYTRRGGLDINPVRVSAGFEQNILPGRLVRQ